MLLHVHGVVAVHAQHTDVQRMVGGQGGESEHRTACRDIGFLEEGLQFALGITQFHALPHECQGLLGVVDELGSLAHSLGIELGIRHVGTDEVDLLRIVVDLLHLGVLGKVEHHRTGTACTGDVEGTTDGPRHVFGVTDLITPLRDGLRHTHEVHLLESVGTEGRDGHLSGNDDDWRGVEHRIGNTREGVRHTRTAGDQGHTHLTGYTGIALGSVGGALLVAHQNMVETFLLASCVVEERVIDGHNAATGVAEDGLHALSLQRPHQRLRSSYSISHFLLFFFGTDYTDFTAFYSIHRLKQC